MSTPAQQDGQPGRPEPESAPTPVACTYTFVDDPACSASGTKGGLCGACHWCMRGKHGPMYWTKGVRP